MIPSFSSNNQPGTSGFTDPRTVGLDADRSGGNIWSTNPSAAAQRVTSQVGAPDHRSSLWGSYPGGSNAPVAEYQQGWTYPQQAHSMHMRESGSVWNTSEHDAWKYSRGQAPQHSPGTGVWNYPTTQQHQEYHDWSTRNQTSAQQAGYYYVPSGHPHDQQAEEYIPYDIGARRSYHHGGMMPPPPPGYPLPPHMQYYGQNGVVGSPAVAAPQAMPHHSPSVDLNPSASIYVPGAGLHVSAPPAGVPVAKPGPASFLFEAAAAAMAKTPESGAVEARTSGSEEFSSEHASKHTGPPTSETGDRSQESPRRGPRPASAAGGAFQKRSVPSRVNNHQLRLHATGNEKAPLATVTSSGQITTLMIRNIPNRYSQSELLAEIREAGFDAKFDFFYLPMDHETHANFGYAFINFLDEREVEPFTKRFHGLKLNRFTSNKIIQIVPAQLQGFQANLQHYCKKAVCTDDNADYRPLFFVDGKCLEFHRASDFTDAVKNMNARAAEAAAAAQGSAAPPRAMTEPEGDESNRRSAAHRGGAKGGFQRKAGTRPE